MAHLEQRGGRLRLVRLVPALAAVVALTPVTPVGAEPPPHQVTKIADLAYGPAVPGNLLDLYLPGVPGAADLPLVIWHSGSAWFSSDDIEQFLHINLSRVLGNGR